ncbi:Flavonoid 3',5'-hydroxylase [Camellia lanceoleosa]|uniref:Flavonoid 3',5'-hydroxylase n=1 Tax=Camellia lanceoleosa TaxID=1840588 RepID=A0ACC0FWZ3_9ERIC|nr:Flavonoid 3',5'-hydroxylase [Camellia lanceoleosa]
MHGSLQTIVKKNQPPLPPGPRGLPVVGILPFLDPELYSCFASPSRTYGPIMRLPMGTKVGIVVSSPFAARKMLWDHGITFANRDVSELASAVVAKGDSDIFFCPHGPRWQMLRKVYVREGQERASIRADFQVVVADSMELLGKLNLLDFFLGLARFDLQGLKKQLLGIVMRFNRIFDAITDKGPRLEDGRQTKDFLQVLLQLKNEGDAKTPLTMTHLKVLFM